jgi:hypothetical protein
VNALYIDNHTVWFNLSAWIGGWSTQDDNARASLIFTNQTNQIVGNVTTIGPVMAAARGSISALVARQATGLVPVSARFMTILVSITCVTGGSNDGDIYNINVVLHQ